MSKRPAKRTKAMRVFLADQRREVSKEDRLAAKQDAEERKDAKLLKRKRKSC